MSVHSYLILCNQFAFRVLRYGEVGFGPSASRASTFRLIRTVYASRRREIGFEAPYREVSKAHRSLTFPAVRLVGDLGRALRFIASLPRHASKGWRRGSSKNHIGILIALRSRP